MPTALAILNGVTKDAAGAGWEVLKQRFGVQAHPPWYATFPVAITLGADPRELAAAFLLFFDDETCKCHRYSDLADRLVAVMPDRFLALLRRVVKDWNGSARTEQAFRDVRGRYQAEAMELLRIPVLSGGRPAKPALRTPSPPMLQGLINISAHSRDAMNDPAFQDVYRRFPEAWRVYDVAGLLNALVAALRQPATRWIAVHGHGGEGGIWAGDEWLDVVALQGNRQLLHPAREFGKGVTILLQGCNSGSDELLIVELSKSLPRPVICAGKRVQYSGQAPFRGSYRQCQAGHCEVLDAGVKDFIIWLMDDPYWVQDTLFF